jgi:hypothetical protein
MEIRQTFNEILVEGTLKEKKLEKTVIDGDNVIKGEVVVITGENQEHAIQIYSNEKTKEGKDNPSYKGLETVMAEYVSMAEAKERGEGTPDKIRCNANIFLNEYHKPTSGEYVGFPRLNTSFLSRVKDEFKPKAIGTIECFINKIYNEIEKGEETGRKIAEVFIINFKGEIAPLDLIVDKDLVDDFDKYFEAGKNAIFNIKLINTANVVKVERGGGFGQSVEKTYTTFKHEIIIIGGEPAQYDEDELSPIPLKIGREEKAFKGYKKDDIRAALKEREKMLEEKKKNAIEGKTGKTTSNKASSNRADLKDW